MVFSYLISVHPSFTPILFERQLIEFARKVNPDGTQVNGNERHAVEMFVIRPLS